MSVGYYLFKLDAMSEPLLLTFNLSLHLLQTKLSVYMGWNFSFGNPALDWIQALQE
jgi:hypothetical protein